MKDSFTEASCPTCKGKRSLLEWGRTRVTCGYCDGTGRIWIRITKG